MATRMHLTTCTNFSLCTAVIGWKIKRKIKRDVEMACMPKSNTNKEGRYSFRDSLSWLVFMIHDQMQSAEIYRSIVVHRPKPARSARIVS